MGTLSHESLLGLVTCAPAPTPALSFGLRAAFALPWRGARGCDGARGRRWCTVGVRGGGPPLLLRLSCGRGLAGGAPGAGSGAGGAGSSLEKGWCPAPGGQCEPRAERSGAVAERQRAASVAREEVSGGWVGGRCVPGQAPRRAAAGQRRVGAGGGESEAVLRARWGFRVHRREGRCPAG